MSIAHVEARRADDAGRTPLRRAGYHGTSIGDLADALGVRKASVYAHIAGKEDLLWETVSAGARAFHEGLDAIPGDLDSIERIRLALRSHLRVVSKQLDVATVFLQEWRYLEGERLEAVRAERRSYERKIRALFRAGREQGRIRADVDDTEAALLFFSVGNWAYTWLKPGIGTDAIADRFHQRLMAGMEADAEGS